MRLVRWSVLLSAAMLIGCQKSEENPAGAESDSSSAMPAEVQVEETETVTSPSGKVLEKVDEVETDVILPTTEPAPEEPKKEEPKKDESGAIFEDNSLVPAAAAESADWGTLTGRFVYDGTAPTPAKLEITKDQEYCGKHADELVDESITVGPGGGIANVFVYIRDKDVKVHPEAEKLAAAPLRMDHKNCRYSPHALGAWAGKQKIVFGNKDSINHAVKIDPINPKNMAINSQMPGGVDIDYTFAGSERVPVAITCGIHPWEKGWILPLDHPYVGVSADDGTFTIDFLPPGKYEFQVWQEKAGYLAAKDDWKRGRFDMTVKPGMNDLGVLKCSPDLFAK